MNKNTFMNNPQYLAQVGHSLGGCLVITLVALFTGSMAVCLAALVVGLALAALKEFWYDANYELPVQTPADNWMDFGFYALGGGVGLGLAALKILVLR